MRRFPSSWDTTLTALGFKRKPRKRQEPQHRKSRLETLEVRALLSATPYDPYATTGVDASLLPADGSTERLTAARTSP